MSESVGAVQYVENDEPIANPKGLSDYLMDLKIASDMQYKELSALCGLSDRKISNLCNGRIAKPYLIDVSILARLFSKLMPLNKSNIEVLVNASIAQAGKSLLKDGSWVGTVTRVYKKVEKI